MCVCVCVALCAGRASWHFVQAEPCLTHAQAHKGSKGRILSTSSTWCWDAGAMPASCFAVAFGSPPAACQCISPDDK